MNHTERSTERWLKESIRWKENQTWSETATVQCTKRLAVSKDFVWENRYVTANI